MSQSGKARVPEVSLSLTFRETNGSMVKKASWYILDLIELGSLNLSVREVGSCWF